MTAIPNSLHKSSDSNASLMELPEHVFGFIDLKTLADIHRYLVESEMEEDIALAKWVYESYLFESADQVGGTIRTTEGFSQLDRAYRRVRLLTNKAQDKWPFFDRNWKEMSSITVRNNARGEIAPGITYSSLPAAKNEAVDLPAIDESDKSKFLPIAHIEIPSETKKAAQIQRGSPLLAQNMHIPLPSSSVEGEEHSEPETQLMEPISHTKLWPEQGRRILKPADEKFSDNSSISADHTSEPQHQTISYSEHANGSIGGEMDNTSEVLPPKSPNPVPENNQPNGNAETLLELIQYPIDGKVRGLNGRYLSKPDSSPIPRRIRRKSTGLQARKKTPSNTGETFKTKVHRRVERKAASDQVPGDLSISIIDENIHSDVQSSSLESKKIELQNGTHNENTPKSGHEVPDHGEAHAVEGLDESAASKLQNDILHDDNESNGSPTSQILAVEAEAVASSLDRLPPNRTQRPIKRPIKRKRESVAEQGERKRGRHGGIVGRPRKSDQRALCAGTDGDKNIEGEIESTVADDTYITNEEAAQRMATRRLTRRSAAPTLETSSPGGNEAIFESDGKQSDLVADGAAAFKDLGAKAGNTGSENLRHESHEIYKGTHTADKVARSPKTSVTHARKPRTQTVSSDLVSLPRQSETDLLGVGLSKTNTSLRRSKSKQGPVQLPGKVIKPGKNAANVKQKPRPLKSAAKTFDPIEVAPVQASGKHDTGPAAQEPTLGHVEYLARIHTSTGAVDVPIAAENLDRAEHESIRKYAEWMATEGGTYIPYQQFRSIFGFAKKG